MDWGDILREFRGNFKFLVLWLVYYAYRNQYFIVYSVHTTQYTILVHYNVRVPTLFYTIQSSGFFLCTPRFYYTYNFFFNLLLLKIQHFDVYLLYIQPYFIVYTTYGIHYTYFSIFLSHLFNKHMNLYKLPIFLFTTFLYYNLHLLNIQPSFLIMYIISLCIKHTYWTYIQTH